MYERSTNVANALGVHCRTGATIAALAHAFDCEIVIKSASHTGDAKSLTDIIQAALACSHKITFIANGDKEKLAVDLLINLVESKFLASHMDTSLQEQFIKHFPSAYRNLLSLEKDIRRTSDA